MQIAFNGMLKRIIHLPIALYFLGWPNARPFRRNNGSLLIKLMRRYRFFGIYLISREVIPFQRNWET